MKPKKGVLILSVAIIVVLGLFVGIKISNSFGGTNSTNKATLNENENLENKQDNKETDDSIGYSTTNEDVNDENVDDSNINDKNREQIDTQKEKILDQGMSYDSSKIEDEEDAQEEENAIQIEVYKDKYAVQKGDTLFSIAREFFPQDVVGKAVKYIALANKINDSNEIYVGQELYIPTQENFEDEEPDKKGTAYKVKVGDTLSSIAASKMTWCSVDTAVELLKESNNIENADLLQANSIIYIPQNEKEGQEESNQN
ncbi:cell division suppressor protein YneA [Clostridium tepidiprofundi DSM 19306]|uniref:Cell division suppressor protein YneA n=1 Tax=Clostridium tepidiprofundi DSM 19306 TaxID=1121338 RepID=A0A151AW76_9CLOT|nr:LysM domain-containing protein [Clostridium tepidiprofundi]KYH31905.1 cell division suppressor protein YneA [Clostridium tepidiprofundi DSM 19306]